MFHTLSKAQIQSSISFPEPMCSKTTDHFNRLPDALLLLIFNKLQDANSLSKCLLVSKRFSSLVPFTNTIFISIPPLQHLSKPNTACSYINTFRLLVHNLFLRPLKCFHQIMASPKAATRSFDSSHYGVLKNFKEINSLHLELPSNGDDLGSDNGASFLKWNAEFGSNLKTCIILGATSFQESNMFSSSNLCLQQKEQESCMEQTLTDDELKLRVIWTISCLIAASTRHHLFKQILADYPIPMLQRVLISDANKQGKLHIGKEELVEMRNSMNSSQQETLESSSSSERTLIPELSMKLWYLPMLELPESGYVMRGATLVLITPVAGMIEERNNGDLMVGSLELEGDGKAFSEAVREMIKVKKSYLMTMSSF